MRVGLIAFVALAVVTLVWAEARHPTHRRPIKMLASTGFLWLAVAVGAPSSTFGRLILGGLALSWVGDLLLTYASRRAFLVGLVAFLAAHVAYANAFLVRGVRADVTGAAAIGVALFAWVVYRWLRPHLEGAMVRAVSAYILVISGMVALAIGSYASQPDWRIIAGALAFFVSDLAVARNQFVARGFVNRAWGLPLYYAAQVLLALSAGA